MRSGIILALIPLVLSLSCLDEGGNPVDTWIAVKEPKGTTYFYYDTTIKSFGLSQYSLNDTSNGALTWTTQQIWTSDTAMYAIYNDEVPDETNYTDTFGHTKGFFAFDSNGDGFYVTHSIPLFPKGPNMTSSYQGLGKNAYDFGQTLLCLSVSAATLDSMASLFLLNRPQIYDHSFPDELQGTYPNIYSLVQGNHNTAATCSYTKQVKTSAGYEFYLFAKSKEWNNDLWSECVSSTLKSSLWVESWLRGDEEGPSCDGTYQTLDVKDVSFESASWTEYNDHSKWAVAVDEKYTCIGDINRMKSQKTRGGGTVCFRNSYVFDTFQSSVSSKNSC